MDSAAKSGKCARNPRAGITTPQKVIQRALVPKL
jgi:hypothetical protein